MKVGIIGSARGCVKTELLNHVPGATVVDLHEDHRSQISNVAMYGLKLGYYLDNLRWLGIEGEISIRIRM